MSGFCPSPYTIGLRTSSRSVRAFVFLCKHALSIGIAKENAWASGVWRMPRRHSPWILKTIKRNTDSWFVNPPRHAASAASYVTRLHFRVQYTVGRFPRLRSGDTNHALITSQLREPPLNVRSMVLNNGGRHSLRRTHWLPTSSGVCGRAERRGICD
jgi:hypothetical protein